MKTKLRIGKIHLKYSNCGFAQPIIRLTESIHSTKFIYDYFYITVFCYPLISILYRIKGRKILVALNNRLYSSWTNYYIGKCDDPTLIKEIIDPIERRFENG